MAINWNLYNTRLNVNGSSNRERNLRSLQNTLTNKLPDSLSYKDVKINNIDANIEIVKTSKDYIKVIHSLPNASFDCGDYVLYNSKTYLITEIDADDDVYTSGKMQECTYVIKFQSSDGTILSYPCITSTKSFNQDDTKVITLNSNQKSILLPFDDNTKLLATDRRFYVDRLNNTTWHIIGAVDNTTYAYGDKGLIYFIVEQDVGQSANDRPDLGICNYFAPIVEPEPPVEGYSYATITCSGDIVVGGVTRTITPTFYEANNTLATGITAVWDIDLPTGYENQFTITYVGNQAKIKVVENYDIIGKTITFNVMGSNGGYGGSLTLTITV